MKTPSNRTRLTVPKIAAFSCPAGRGQAFLWDTQTPGFALRASAGGRKSFIFEGRLRGKTLRLSIGDAAAWTLGDARTEAQRLRLLVDTGTDPRELARQQEAERQAAAAQAQAEALTVGEVWPAYLAARRPHWGERHYIDHVRAAGAGVNRPGPLHALMRMRMADLNTEAVELWAQREGADRPTQARLSLRLLKAFLGWCAERPEYRSILPAANAAKSRRAREALGKPQAKSDALLKEQLPAWFAAVRAIQNPAISAYLQALLLTGARPGELMALRWEDIDARWRSLTLRDKDESRGGRDGFRLVPLTPYVHSLLAGLPRRSEWVFARARGGEPMAPPYHEVAKVCAVAGIGHMTLHGLRRSFGTLAEWTELPAGVVAQLQGHKPSATAEKYYRVRPLDLLRVHHEKLEAWILEQAGVQFDADAEPGKLHAV